MLITQPTPDNREITCLPDASLREFTVMLPKGHRVITAIAELMRSPLLWSQGWVVAMIDDGLQLSGYQRYEKPA
jgi:hypothetical protein